MTLKRSFIAWAAMVASAGVLTACGGASPTSSSSASAAGQAGGQSAPGTQPPHPCTLVTKDEAAAMLGGAVQNPVEDTTTLPGATKCTYTSASDSTNVVEVSFLNDDANGTLYNHINGQGNNTPVAGVGDAAFCIPDALGHTQVEALSKAKGLIVVVQGLTSNSCDQAKAFALKVLSRL
ncbi:MAG: DUF3558 family protein [Candidatus Dormibacteraeota bacterium]|uniref:DUF3558 family protein n=1 Tax=Candidatus Amunia macphersoniae TaxID=3127014 RepID=A0A934KRK9_9BACT|nr:DUF3558 family protein [Candidatus Dormibacteraeota bacterium]